MEIVAWDKPEVPIEAEIRGKTADDLQRIRVEFETDATHVAVKTKLEKNPACSGATAREGRSATICGFPPASR